MYFVVALDNGGIPSGALSNPSHQFHVVKYEMVSTDSVKGPPSTGMLCDRLFLF